MSKANKVRFELRIEEALEQYETCLDMYGDTHYNTAFSLGKLSGLLELYNDIYGYNYNKEGNTQ